MSHFAHPEVLISSQRVGMDCCGRHGLAPEIALGDLANRQSTYAGSDTPDEAELMALMDAVLPTLRTWVAPPAAIASHRRAA